MPMVEVEDKANCCRWWERNQWGDGRMEVERCGKSRVEIKGCVEGDEYPNGTHFTPKLHALLVLNHSLN